MGSNMKVDVRVGIFVALGLALLMGTIISLGGEKSLFKVYYTLKVRLPQVQGLAAGSVVSLAGMPVGNVAAIRFDESGKGLVVELGIDQDYMKRITEDATAGVRTQGALGDKYVYIAPGSLDRPPLQDGAEIAAESSPDFIDVIAEKGPQLANIVDVIKEMHILLKNLNADNRSGVFMQNMVASSESLKKVLAETHVLVSDLRGKDGKGSELKQSLASLNSVLKKIDRGDGTLGALINDSSLHDRLMGIVGESPRNKYLKPLIRATIQKQDEKK